MHNVARLVWANFANEDFWLVLFCGLRAEPISLKWTPNVREGHITKHVSRVILILGRNDVQFVSHSMKILAAGISAIQGRNQCRQASQQRLEAAGYDERHRRDALASSAQAAAFGAMTLLQNAQSPPRRSHHIRKCDRFPRGQQRSDRR